MHQVHFFKSVYGQPEPEETDLASVLKGIKDGSFKEEVERYRKAKADNSPEAERLKHPYQHLLPQEPLMVGEPTNLF